MAAKRTPTTTAPRTTAKKSPSKRSGGKTDAGKATAKKPPKAVAATTDVFEGFDPAGLKFFRELAKNQDRAWFQENKGRYEELWVHPMTALLEELRARLGSTYEDFGLGEPKIFRIHRDVRFSKDKSPYKTHIGGYVPLAGHERSGPTGGPVAIYLHVGLDDEFSGAGLYAFDKKALENYRAAILDDELGGELQAIVDALSKAGHRIAAMESLKSVPRGFDPEHPRADLLKHKGMVSGWPTLPKGLVHARDLVEHLLAEARRSAPLVKWVAANV